MNCVSSGASGLKFSADACWQGLPIEDSLTLLQPSEDIQAVPLEEVSHEKPFYATTQHPLMSLVMHLSHDSMHRYSRT